MTDYEDYEDLEIDLGDMDDYWHDTPGHNQFGNVDTTTTKNTRTARSAALKGDDRVQINAITKDGKSVPVFRNPGHQPGISQEHLRNRLEQSGFSFKKFIQSETHGYVRASNIVGFQVTRYESE